MISNSRTMGSRMGWLRGHRPALGGLLGYYGVCQCFRVGEDESGTYSHVRLVLLVQVNTVPAGCRY